MSKNHRSGATSGLVVTALVGRYSIAALNRRLAQQALIEQQPDDVRRSELAYDVALARLSKGVCHGCERPVDLKSADNQFCPHCGIGLLTACVRCAARKNAFSPFYHACGAPAAASQARVSARSRWGAVAVGIARRMTATEVRARLVVLEIMRLVSGREDLDGRAPRRMFHVTAEGRRQVGISDVRRICP